MSYHTLILSLKILSLFTKPGRKTIVFPFFVFSLDGSKHLRRLSPASLYPIAIVVALLWAWSHTLVFKLQKKQGNDCYGQKANPRKCRRSCTSGPRKQKPTYASVLRLPKILISTICHGTPPRLTISKVRILYSQSDLRSLEIGQTFLTVIRHVAMATGGTIIFHGIHRPIISDQTGLDFGLIPWKWIALLGAGVSVMIQALDMVDKAMHQQNSEKCPQSQGSAIERRIFPLTVAIIWSAYLIFVSDVGYYMMSLLIVFTVSQSILLMSSGSLPMSPKDNELSR